MNDLSIGLIHVEDLACELGYDGPTNAFRAWCASLRITPVPGRKGWYDRKLVRRRLDEAQGLMIEPLPGHAASQSLSLVEQRRARRGAA
jgi:hypothetical protein